MHLVVQITELSQDHNPELVYTHIISLLLSKRSEDMHLAVLS